MKTGKHRDRKERPGAAGEEDRTHGTGRDRKDPADQDQDREREERRAEIVITMVLILIAVLAVVLALSCRGKLQAEGTGAGLPAGANRLLYASGYNSEIVPLQEAFFRVP